MMLQRSSLAVLLCLVGWMQSMAGSSSGKSFTLVTQNSEGWEVEYKPAARTLTTVEVDGKVYFRFSGPAVNDNGEEAEGNPALPADAFSLGIPDGATVTVELVNPEFEITQHQVIAPHPAYKFTEEQEAVEVFRKNAGAYARNQFFPSSQITVEPPFTLRGQRVTCIRIRPYQYNPSTQTLRRIINATLRIRIQNSSGLALFNSPTASSDPFFEETYKTLLLNYEQAKAWRLSPEKSPLVDPTGTWFETRKFYYKALVANDGWYKITRADLQAAGANLSLIDLPSLKVFSKGQQIPIVVRPDTTVEFYAYHNVGDSTYADFYTDTSAYWLTWGGTAGLRFTSSAPAIVPVLSLSSATCTVHLEQNLSYFIGTTQDEQINNNTVPGEDWYWQLFGVNAQTDFPFSLDSADNATPTSTVRARVYGIGYNASPSPPALHKARVWINDSLAGEVSFNQRTGAILTATIPTTWLKPGTNTFRLKNIDTGTSGNTFYLDWFEIDYPRKLRPTNDLVSFSSPPLPAGSQIEFQVKGFSNSQIEVYDISSRRMITTGTVSADLGSGFSITVPDTVSSPRTYVVFAANSQRAVPPLKQKMFGDIRSNTVGADYLIISHKNFLPQANQLAAHRQATNACRTKVIDVEDIYDEFNYGVMNATKIKSFLVYASQNWPGPSPSYLLLFGDASWDYHRYMSSTVKSNFVPAYGIPAGDNWYACFDPVLTFIPSMYVGRIPAENSTQAQTAVDKVIGYDNYRLSDWNKNFLFITGGNTLSEQIGFNYLAESAIQTYINPPPLGATALRVYKTTAGWVEGESKQVLKNYFRDGLVFLNFTGHSGGRIWGVDPGPPAELENTNGKLPFVSSVSCNVGGFATPQGNVLAEDFLFADNRGAIASWASSSLGYATYGAALTNYWLDNASNDSVREFGKLTSNARYQLWAETGAGYITIAMVNLNPLIGDPMSKLAVPLKPDLAIMSSDITTNKPLATPNDTSLTIRLKIHNYGLVPQDSVGVTLTDLYNGQTTYLLNNYRMPRTLSMDSLFVPWSATGKIGPHTLAAALDPVNTINEVSEMNNIASADQYIYTNNLFVVKPLNNMAVPAGVQRLVVTSPIGFDSSGFQYFFELDSVDTFNSPTLISSGAITPGSVIGEWFTPSLPVGGTYFWRARTVHGSLTGNWVTASFMTSSDLPSSNDAIAPLVRWRENSKKQFAREALVKTAATDSGVTIARSSPLYLYVRSVGNRPNQGLEYYSSFQINDQKITGYWWELGNSFMVVRLNEFTGAYEFRNFDVRANVALADSMKNFLNNTPPGNYIGITVIFNGQTNVNEGLMRAMDTLGATMFRSIINGQSYAFIGRKGNGGPGMPPLEQLTNDTAVVSLTIPNYYSLGTGSITSSPIPIARAWDSFHWRRTGDINKTNSSAALLGVRTTGAIDTLRMIPYDSIDVNLASLNSQTQGPRYSSLKVSGLLSTSDANVTPLLTDWWLDFSPPADLAVSARTVGVSQTDGSNSYNLPITIHNIGYAKSDSAKVVVYALDKYNASRQIATAVFDSVDIDASRSTTVNFSTLGLPRKTRLQVVVGSAKKGRDLIAENNTAYYMIYVNNIALADHLRVYANGTEVMDGDYISPTPTLLIRTSLTQEENPQVERSELFVDKKPAVSVASMPLMKGGGTPVSSEQTFTPTLANGHHELKFRLSRMNLLGEIDSTERTVHVNVLNESRLLQVYNYPNPFSSETDFTFILTGTQVADEVSIKIFTVAGRKIREIVLPPSSLQLGFNRVHWNGRDEDGDEVANGYYFYQVRLKADDTTVSSIQKLVKIK